MAEGLQVGAPPAGPGSARGGRGGRHGPERSGHPAGTAMVALARPLLRPGCAGGSAASPHGHRRAGVRHRFSPWRLINEPEGFQPPGEELSRVTKAALLRKLQWFSPRGSSVKLPLCPCLVFWCRFQEIVLPQDGVCVYGPSEVMAQFKLT